MDSPPCPKVSRSWHVQTILRPMIVVMGEAYGSSFCVCASHRRGKVAVVVQSCPATARRCQAPPLFNMN